MKSSPHKQILQILGSRKAVFIFTAFFFAASLSSPSFGYSTGSNSVGNRELKNSVNEVWSSSKKYSDDDFTEIEVTVADDGKIYEPVVTHYCSDDQHNAECLEAICSLSPLNAWKNNPTCRLNHYTVRFTEKDGVKPRFDGVDVAEYLRAKEAISRVGPEHPKVLIHRIPLSVLKRYPGFFSEKDLLSPSNLIEILLATRQLPPPDEKGQRLTEPPYVKSIGDFYAGWALLFRKPSVTKEEIQEHGNSKPGSVPVEIHNF